MGTGDRRKPGVDRSLDIVVGRWCRCGTRRLSAIDKQPTHFACPGNIVAPQRSEIRESLAKHFADAGTVGTFVGYKIDDYQQTYFVIDSFEQLIAATAPDFTPIYAQLAQGEAYPAGRVLENDKLFNRGTGEGWATDADV